MSPPAPIAGPDESDYAREWWAGIGHGRLTVQNCRTCHTSQLYPRRRCVTCSSDDLAFVAVSGEGSVYTYSTVYRNPPSDFVDQLPYTLGIVILDEGPRLLTRIVGCTPEEVGCDMRVRLVISAIG